MEIVFLVEVEVQKLLEMCVGEARQVREQQRCYTTAKGHLVRGRDGRRERERERDLLAINLVWSPLWFSLISVFLT